MSYVVVVSCCHYSCIVVSRIVILHVVELRLVLLLTLLFRLVHVSHSQIIQHYLVFIALTGVVILKIDDIYGFYTLSGLSSHRKKTCRLRVWCIPTTSPGAGSQVMGMVLLNPTQGLPVMNPTNR